MTAIKERPILASSRMVRAILDGTKTQTRRLMKPQPSPGFLARGVAGVVAQWPHQDGVRWFMKDCLSELVKSPYGKPGDRLWVRESFALSVRDPEGFPPDADPSNWDVVYRADGGDSGHWQDNIRTDEGGWASVPIKAPWKPSIHMTRWACRITLEITKIRVEQVQSISLADALAEGVASIAKYREWWDEIHHGSGHSWASNPWVWVVAFRVVKGDSS